MKTVTSRRELKNETDMYILVQRENMMYVRVDDEYVPKPYFTTQDAMRILKQSFRKVHKLCRKLGIQARANRGQHIRITLSQLRQMAEHV